MSNPAIKSDLPANNSAIIPMYVPFTLTDHVPSGDKWYEDLLKEKKFLIINYKLFTYVTLSLS